jgi:hypothetical protein
VSGPALQVVADTCLLIEGVTTMFEYDLFATAWGHGANTDSIKGELNQRGAQGWELVGMTRDESPADDHDEEHVLFVFKRMKK